jgi:aspartate aminotransferase
MQDLPNIPTSPTAAIYSLAQQKKAAGVKVYNLSAGEPKLNPHPAIVQAVINAMEKGHTAYPPVAGLPELRTLAASWMNAKYGCSFTTQSCLVTPGGKFGIYLLSQLLLSEGDEVIIPAPYWVSYPSITRLFSGTPHIVPTKEADHWKLTPEQLQNACNKNSKILMLNNATNPTGTLYTREELSQLLQIAKQNNVIVISDEVYSELVYDGDEYVSCGEFHEHQDNVIIIQSCSKNFSMTGWRVGFVFAPEKIIPNLIALNSQSSSGACTVSQWAAVGAFEQADEISGWVRENMLQRRDAMLATLQQHVNKNISAPLSALYFFISMQDLGLDHTDSTEYCKTLLEQKNVALVPGKAFGQEGFVRFSFGEDIKDLVDGVKKISF